MTEITDTILINQPVEIIFDFLTDLENLSVRIPSVTKVAMISGGEMRVGTQFLVTSRAKGKKTKIVYEVMECEKNQAYETKIISGSQPFQERYQLAKDENGTRVTLTAIGDMPGLIRIFIRSFERLLKKQVEKDLERLKDLLEGDG